MTKTRNLTLGLAGVALLAAACSAQSGTSNASGGAAVAATANGANSTNSGNGPNGGLAKVLFLGDSIAVQESLPLAAAFKASHVQFQSIAADGGGNVLGPASDNNWQTLPGQIASAKPSVLVYQIASYDWGSQQDQQAAYQKLLATATANGAKLLFVTMPPIKADDFYQPHMADLARTKAAAQAVAAGARNQAAVLDAAAVWGPSYQQDRDGKPDRSSDGVHTCPQSAARFTNWLLDQLHGQFAGFNPAPAQAWANAGWSASPDFHGC
ncbi:hypothetical protein KGQ20_23465 [Catenulispora sp. NF23]|uniref:SGNH/GDSL hydrolase family protein n=1 Tax=Catenulispora pinistramenti TaxID=2705254 RepID=UPI001BA8151F|nr:hypothetical protein [Catenulispora pinistramenti]MBS2535725.1 hypothetical protein [Catenulispora pinistramenti]